MANINPSLLIGLQYICETGKKLSLKLLQGGKRLEKAERQQAEMDRYRSPPNIANTSQMWEDFAEYWVKQREPSRARTQQQQRATDRLAGSARYEQDEDKNIPDEQPQKREVPKSELDCLYQQKHGYKQEEIERGQGNFGLEAKEMTNAQRLPSWKASQSQRLGQDHQEELDSLNTKTEKEHMQVRKEGEQWKVRGTSLNQLLLKARTAKSNVIKAKKLNKIKELCEKAQNIAKTLKRYLRVQSNLALTLFSQGEVMHEHSYDICLMSQAIQDYRTANSFFQVTEEHQSRHLSQYMLTRRKCFNVLLLIDECSRNYSNTTKEVRALISETLTPCSKRKKGREERTLKRSSSCPFY